MAINFKRYIIEMKNERYMGSIIYGEANCGKTKFIKDFINKSNDFDVTHLDFINVLDKLEVKSKVIQFLPNSFFKFILELIKTECSKTKEAVILDNIDVVLNLWSINDKNEFVNQLMTIEKSMFNFPITAIAPTS